MINVYSNIDAFSRSLNAIARQQLPFATAQALTQLAREVVPQEQAAERINLDRPRPFTQDAVRALGASKTMPIARVVMMDRAAGYLEPYEFGGFNVLNGRALLKPIGQALDQYGNIPDRTLAKLKGRADVFIGPVKTKDGVINGVWQRSVAAGTRVKVTSVTKAGKVRVRKTAKAVNSSGHLKLLIRFTDAHVVRQKIHWFDTAKGLVDRRFNAVFGAALAKAIASKKP